VVAKGARLGLTGLIAGGLALGIVSGCIPPESEQSRPLERAVWIGRVAWRASQEEEQALRAIGPQRIFFTVGDLDLEGDRVRWHVGPAFPHSLPQSEGILVIGSTMRFVENFNRVPEASLAESVATLLREAVDRAKKAGLSCSGVHLDIPVRGAMERYGRVLERLRARMPRPMTLSATIPVAWASERALAGLVRKLDFYLLRLVSEESPADLASLRPSVDARQMGSWIRRFEPLGVPFSIEAREEGRCFLLDSAGRVIAPLRDVAPLRLMRHLGFRLVESYPLGLAEVRMRVPTDFAGEYVVVLMTRATSRLGDRVLRPGDRIACRLPTARALRRQLEAFEAQTSLLRRGYVLWYSGAADDGLSLPLAQMARLVRGGVLEPKLRVKGEIAGALLRVRVENVGLQESALLSRAVEVRVRVEGADVLRIDPGDFLGFMREPFSGREGASITFYADGIGRGETLRASLRIAPRGSRIRVLASYRVRDPDDFIMLSGPEVEVLAISRGLPTPSARRERS
jgi:hypothetical protein